MDRIAEIEIRKPDKIQQFKLSQDIQLQKGDFCIVELSQGAVDYGKLCRISEAKPFLKFNIAGRVLRKLTEADILTIEENIKRKTENLAICRAKVKESKLPMKLVDAEYSFDKTRVTFYYWAEERVDFRNLVKELAKIFNCRIEMRQIGLRDEAKIKGGYGICGRPLCCSTFLKKFESVTMRMVKNQKLPLDINKITGQCGRLLCCLGYEDEFYKKKEDEK
ncbi:MAG TPA: regulatory iron-sulfur-containing complex subunit RicT [bacterium]|nr:regulatory iron-sulfur-containing complex subunit RicT [bacterium]